MMNQDNYLSTVLWVGCGFVGMCVVLFWTKIAAYLDERRELRKARFWRLKSRIR